MIRFTVEGKPIQWMRAGKKGKRHFTPEKMANYKNAVATLAKKSMGQIPPLAGPVSCFVVVDLPIPESYSKARKARCAIGQEMPAKRPDLDNYIKLALDAMNKIVFDDDAQVCTLMSNKRYSAEPKLEITVSPL